MNFSCLGTFCDVLRFFADEKVQLQHITLARKSVFACRTHTSTNSIQLHLVVFQFVTSFNSEVLQQPQETNQRQGPFFLHLCVVAGRGVTKCSIGKQMGFSPDARSFYLNHHQWLWAVERQVTPQSGASQTLFTQEKNIKNQLVASVVCVCVSSGSLIRYPSLS